MVIKKPWGKISFLMIFERIAIYADFSHSSAQEFLWCNKYHSFLKYVHLNEPTEHMEKRESKGENKKYESVSNTEVVCVELRCIYLVEKITHKLNIMVYVTRTLFIIPLTGNLHDSEVAA